MNGTDPQTRGAAPFVGEHITLETSLDFLPGGINPYQKFSEAQPEDLRLTEELLARLPGMPEKSIRRKYVKLPRAFQKAMSFAYNLGWPAVDLFQLFLGTNCPENCLFRGAAILAEEGCTRIHNKVLVDPLKLKGRHLTEGNIDEMLEASPDLSGLISELADQMERDLSSCSRYLQNTDRADLKILITETREHQIESDKNELRDKILQFYRKIGVVLWNSRKKKSSAGAAQNSDGSGSQKNTARKRSRKGEDVLKGQYQENEAAMRSLAAGLWSARFFKKLYSFLGAEVMILFHPFILAKALFFLTPRQRNLVELYDLKNPKVAEKLAIKVGSVGGLRRKSFQRLAEAIRDLRIFSSGLNEAAQSVPVALSSPAVQATEKKTEHASKKARRANRSRQKMFLRIPPALRPGLDPSLASDQLSFLGVVKRKPNWLKTIILAEDQKVKEQKRGRKEAESLARHHKRLSMRLRARIPSALRPGLDPSLASDQLSFLGFSRKKPGWLKKIRLAEKCELKREAKKARQLKPRTIINAVGGWQQKFLKEELEINIPIATEAWRTAFSNILGYERDVIRFCFGKQKSFADFSREKYGTAAGASIAYKNAKRKLREILGG